MITLLRSGRYKLIQTKRLIKIIYLDSDVYAWVKFENIGEILVYAQKNHTTNAILASGEYRIYDVVDEPHIADIQHLELEIGDGKWQRYILLTGLPDQHKRRARIIPTHELISSSPALKGRKVVVRNLAQV